MLRRETVSALRAYTQLAEDVQGILQRHGDQYEFAGGILRSDSLERALRSIDVDAFCVSKLRVLSDVGSVAGAVDGAFVLRGKAIKVERRMLAIVNVVAGQVPADLRNADNLYLVSLSDEDFLRCSVPQQIPYGVNAVTDALAPRWNYLSAVYSKQVQHVVVACPNGIFCFRSAAVPSELPPAKAAELVKNLVRVDLVVEAEGGSGAGPRTISRVAANCLFVGPEHARPQLAALRRNLQVPGYLEGGKALPSSLPLYGFDASLLEPSGPEVSYEAVRNSLPASAAVQRQPFEHWWSAPASFVFRCTLSGAAGDETPVEMRMRFREGRARDVDVAVELRAAPFRELRPGESEAALRQQLEAVFESSVALALSDFSARSVEQGSLDKLTRQLAEVLASNVNKALLFKDAVAVAVKTSFDQVEGETVRLPSGDAVVVPRYSFDLDSVRLNAYLGVFAALGLQGSFYGWDQALKSRVVVT